MIDRLLTKLAPSLLFIAAIAQTGCALVVAQPVIAIAPPTAVVRPDAAAGYTRYHDVLAAAGTWEPDPTYGARWCPSAEATGFTSYRPYYDKGHWAVSDRAYGDAPAGSLAWQSEDSDTSGWSEITSHHGYWFQVDDTSDAAWCWVPGVEEVAARVVYRMGDGFIGWAPEPVDCCCSACDDGDDLAYDALAWTFTFVGTLLDGAPADQKLDGDAKQIAMAATSRRDVVRTAKAARPTREAPKIKDIAAAHLAFEDYAKSHGEKLRDAAIKIASARAKTSDVGASSTETASKSKESSGKSKSESSSESSSDAKAKVKVSAMAYYDAMLDDPMMGPVGVAPRFLPEESAPSSSRSYGSSFASASSAMTSGGARSSIRARLAEASAARSEAARSWTPRSSSGSSSSHSSSSHSSSSRSSSSHSSSSHSSSGHSGRR